MAAQGGKAHHMDIEQKLNDHPLDPTQFDHTGDTPYSQKNGYP